MKGLTLWILLLSSLNFWPVQVYAANLQISFPADTLLACADEPFTLTPQVSGGIGPLHYYWSTGDTTPMIWTVPGAGTTLFVLTVTDQAAQQVTDSVWITGLPECVWPGDANGDGQANNVDLLMLGVAYGVQGDLRPNAHLQWIGQPAPAWSHTFAAGVNYVHADGDGDGLVDQWDIEAIQHNYLAPQGLAGASPLSPQGIPLYVDMPSGSFIPGDTVVAPIILGTAQVPADSIYGLAFSVNYEAFGIEANSISIDYAGSWLGQEGQTLITIDRNFPQVNQLDVGMSRINQIARSGYGRLGDITVVIDDIAGKRSGIEMVSISLDQITLIGKHGQPLPVDVSPAQLTILLSQEAPARSTNVNIYQTHDEWLIVDEAAGRYGLRQSEWLDVQGRRVAQQVLSPQSQLRLPLPALAPGLYVVRMYDEKRWYHQKIYLR